MYSLDELSAKSLYDLFVNDLDVQSINVRLRDICGLHKFFITGQKRLSGNFRPRDVRESVDATLEIDLTGLFCLVLESVLNGLNGLERIVPGTLIEIPLLTLV